MFCVKNFLDLIAVHLDEEECFVGALDFFLQEIDSENFEVKRGFQKWFIFVWKGNLYNLETRGQRPSPGINKAKARNTGFLHPIRYCPWN